MSSPPKTIPPTPPAADADYQRVLDEPLPAPDDPGGAHAKGYSADPSPERPVPHQGPVPLVPDADVQGHVVKPKPGPLPPTGRSEPKDYTPNDRLMGSDR